MRILNHFLTLLLVIAFCVQNVHGTGDSDPPTILPTEDPSVAPSEAPSEEPTIKPTNEPTATPTVNPSLSPTLTPTTRPTTRPSKGPTTKPTRVPTCTPTARPTKMPTVVPTAVPTSIPHPEDPRFVSYSLDCGIGKLTMNFDTAISAKTMNVRGITFQTIPNYYDASANTRDIKFRLNTTYNDLFKQGNTTELTIYLSSEDFANMKLTPLIGRSISTTFLTMVRDTVLSPFGLANVEVNTSHAIAPSTLVLDNFPPYVSNFVLIMDTGLLTISFSEPIDVSTFSLDGLTMQSTSYLGDATNDAVVEARTWDLAARESSFVAIGNLQRKIVYQLGPYNLNHIKAKVGLADNILTTYLSAWKPFVSDLSGNPVSLVGFDKLHGLKASYYLPDTVPPTLQYWDFDRNSGKVSLAFSETVYRVFFNFSKVVFVSGASADYSTVSWLRLDRPVNFTTPDFNSELVEFTLNTEQFDLVKAMPDLLTSPALNSFLVLEHNIVVDTAELQNVYQGTDATPTHPRAVRHFTADNIAPRLVSFVLDMDARLVSLTFSETVKLSSVIVAELTLQSDRSIGVSTEVLRLSHALATLHSTRDSPLVQLHLTTSAFAQLKAFQRLAKSAASSFVSLTRDFVSDRAGNSTVPANQVEEVPPSGGRMAADFFPDRSAPFLESWYCDLTLDHVVLTFSKPVDATSMRPELMSLSSDQVPIPSTVSVALTEGSYVASQVLNIVTIQLSANDGKQIRMRAADNLCVSVDSCFLTLSAGFVNDSAAVSIDGEVVRTALMPVERLAGSAFLVDTVAPVLLNYSMNLNTRIISFVFNEPVNVRAVQASVVTLSYLDATWGTKSVALSEYAVPVDSATHNRFDLQFTKQDAIHLQQAAPLASTIDTVNLTASANFVADVAGNAFVFPSLAEDGSFAPFAFEEDRTPPVLLAVYLNKDSDSTNLTLHFNELVDTTTILQSALFLASSSGATVPLTTAVLLTNESTSQHVTYSLLPLSAELARVGVANSQLDTHVYIGTTGAVRDSSRAQNLLSSMTITDAVRDGLSVVSFRLDMSAHTLALELAYVSDVSLVDSTKLTIYSSDLSKSYTLKTSSSFVVDDAGPVLIIALSDADYRAIRFTFTITSRSSIVLLAGASSVVDSNGKALSKSGTLACSHFQAETAQLTLDSFVLDLTAGTLRLYFSKEGETSTADLADSLALYTSAAGDDVLPLSNLTIIDEPDLLGYVAPNVTTLLLSLNNGAPLTTREQIILARPLASTLGSTYLSVRKGLIYDLARPRNPLQERSVRTHTLLSPTVLTLDTSAPLFVSFDLDLNTRLLTLVFSEAVNMASVNVETITFLADPKVATSTRYKLTTTSVVISTEPNPSVIIELSEFDVNVMMALSPRLLHSAATCYISMAAGAVHDFAVPPNAAPTLLHRYGMPVRRFVADAAAPELLWYNVSMQTGDLVMYFNELIDCSTVNAHQIMFQVSQFTGTKNLAYRLSESSSVDCGYGPPFDNLVYVTIDPLDVIALKTFPVLAKTSSATYLRLLPGAVKDTFGNGNAEILDGYAVLPSLFIPDTAPPQLLSFLVNDDQKLTLFFDEPVDTRTIAIHEYWIQNAYSAPTHSYPLVDSKLVSVDASRMRLVFDVAKDMTRMLSGQNLFMAQQAYTYLRVSSDAIKDISGNPLLERTRYNSLQLGPSVVTWDIDANTGVVRLTFSEPVNPAFSMVGFRVQDAYSSDNTSFAFTTTTPVTAGTGGTVSVLLNPHDLNALKLSGLIEGSTVTSYDIEAGTGNVADLFLTADYGVTTSSNAGDLTPYLPTVEILVSNAVRVRRLRKDVTAPVCVSFRIDLNEGTLVLTFDEPVDVHSLRLPLLVLSSSQSGRFVTLSDADRQVSLVDATDLRVTLSSSDLNAFKRAISDPAGLMVLDSLVMYAGAVKDLRGNAFPGNDPDHTIAIAAFTPDTTPPLLVSWTLDRSALLMHLFFNEFVSEESVKPYHLELLSTANYLSAPQRLQLTNYSKIHQGDQTLNEIIVDLGLYRQDGFALQQLAALGLGNGVSDTFLAVTSLSDIFGNTADTVQVVAVTSVKVDSTPLLMQAFDWVHGAGDTEVTLVVYFSKVVNISTFECADLTLRSEPTRLATHAVSLTNTDCALIAGQGNSHIVSFSVPFSLFSGTTIGAAPEATWLGVPVQGQTQDLSGNPLALIRSEMSTRVGPQLLRANLNVNTGVVDFDFNKRLDLSTPFSASTFGFFSLITRQEYFLLSESTPGGLITLSQPPQFASMGPNCSIGEITLDSADLTNLKLIDVQPNNLYALVAEDSALLDYQGFNLAPKTVLDKLLVSDIAVDNVAPVIADVSIDLSVETITIEFSEPIRLSTVVVPHFCLQGTANLATAPASFYCLTTSVPTIDVSTLTLTLSPEDAAAIKLTPGLASSVTDTFLSFEFFTAEDIAGNQLPATTTVAARAFDALVVDTIAPTLDSFTFNPSHPSHTLITLVFSEPVRTDLLNLQDFVVQSRYASRDGARYVLTGGTVISFSLYSVTIELLAADVTAMKLIPGLIRTRESTYLLVQAGATTDLAGNPLVAYLDGEALKCLVFVRDSSPPTIVQSLFDLDAGRITFVFNEPVVRATVDVSALTIQLPAAASTPGLVSFSNTVSKYALSTLSYVSNANLLSETVVVNLAQTDQDELKNRFPLVSSQAYTWFSFTPLFVEDTVHNSIVAVRATAPVQATGYVKDTTRPTVTRYALDKNRQLVTLTFSEGILASSVDLSQLNIQNIEARRFGVFSYLNESTYSVGAGSASNTLKVRIGDNTVAFMKENGIGANLFQSFLCWTDNFVSDHSGNYLRPVWDGSVQRSSPRVPDELAVDRTAPSLQRWYLHRERTDITAYLFFDEPVRLVEGQQANVYYTTRTAGGKPVTFGTTPMSLYPPHNTSTPPAVTYKNNHRQLLVRLANYCTASGESTADTACLASRDPARNLFAFLNQTAATAQRGYFLTLGAGALEDFAEKPNPSLQIVERKQVLEGGPDCSTCPVAGQYVSTNCTTNSDRHCKSCSSCGSGEYIYAACSSYDNTACTACATCGFGKYIASPCSGSRNTECASCSTCGPMQYASRPCERGLNTVCNSCAACTFPDAAVQKLCEADKGYYTWAQANCCKDKKGKRVACEQRDRSAVLQAAVDGRHHWAFDSTSPHIDVARNPGLAFPRAY